MSQFLFILQDLGEDSNAWQEKIGLKLLTTPTAVAIIGLVCLVKCYTNWLRYSDADIYN